MSAVEVVSACIVHGHRVLLTQRRADKDFPFMWESPGGKVDAGETHHLALARELYEEIGLDVFSSEPECFWSQEFANLVQRHERSRIRLHFYRVFYPWARASIAPREGQGLGWFTPDELRRLTLAPGNAAALEAIVEQIGRAV